MNSNLTIRESADLTIRESEVQIPEKSHEENLPRGNFNLIFPECEVISQLPVSGAEADLFKVIHQEQERLLKLYRPGVDPQRELLELVQEISMKSPEHLVQIYKAGFEPSLRRWYEIQEYIEEGSLLEMMTQEFRPVLAER
mgnify:CR=1 FL=1